MSSHLEKADKTKRRSDMACRRCRARKLKCENKDSVAPCKRCEGENVECVFVPVADDTKPPKTANSSRGSSEDRRSNNQSGTSTSPAQVMTSASSTNERTAIQSMSSPPRGAFSTSSTYYPHPPNSHVHPQITTNASPPTEERTDTSFSSLHYRDATFLGLDGSPTSWPNPTQPGYSSHPIMTPPYVNQGQPQPPAPSQYTYSPSPDPSYSREIYSVEQQPRAGIHAHQPYYTSGDAVHESQNSQHPYYPSNGQYRRSQPQPSGLPAYPDPRVGPQHDNNNFYGHYR